MSNFEMAKKNFSMMEQCYSKYATKSYENMRMIEIDEDIRTPFFRDVDRIIYAFSYVRYSDKTQVFRRGIPARSLPTPTAAEVCNFLRRRSV